MKSSELTLTKISIGELVTQDWRKAEVFKKYGIDYCCGGKKTVAEACAKKGIEPAVVEAELEQIELRPLAGMGSANNYNQWSLDFLADYIVNTHHHYVKEAVPFLEELSAKVARVHGGHRPELLKIQQHAQSVIDELTLHMHKEEVILFPYIKELAQAKKTGTSIARPPFGTIANPINMMEAEHVSAGEDLEAIEELSERFTPPDEACMSYRVLFAKLQEFQQDLHQHIHLENNILFPKALKLEEELLKG
jgi:regulator of cell morphogenesis and NO signaling